jgi:hypothetical protein
MKTPETEDLNKLAKEEPLAQQLAAANQTIAEMKAQQQQNVADEKLIGEKMNRGLSRHQAIAVIERQRKFDLDLEEKAKSAKK